MKVKTIFTNKTSNIIVLTFFFCLVNAFSSCEKQIGAGSYNDAERYTVNASEQEIITAINRFKVEYPDMCPPKGSSVKDGRPILSDGTEDYWYEVYFYYPNSKKTIFSWVRGSTFALISISAENTDKNWLTVNDKLKDSENATVKKEFEERILNPIKEILKRK